MRDQRHLALGELGQRLRAMSRPMPTSEPVEADGAVMSVEKASVVPQIVSEPASTEVKRLGQALQSATLVQPVAPDRAPPERRASSQPAPSHAGAGQVPLGNGMKQSNAPKSGMQRVMRAARHTLPLVQKLLPLLDGNIAMTVGALIAGHSAAPPVDLQPVERGLAQVQLSHIELTERVSEQGSTLKRVGDQLEQVREATDRNTLEQQELSEHLRSVGKRVVIFAVIGLLLLTLSLGINVYLLVQMQHIAR